VAKISWSLGKVLGVLSALEAKISWKSLGKVLDKATGLEKLGISSLG